MPNEENKQYWDEKAKELGKRGEQVRDSSLIFTISLSFSVLGLSSQYPSHITGYTLPVIQLVGWLLLFFAGILGLVLAVRLPMALFGLSIYANLRGRSTHAEVFALGATYSVRERRMIRLGFLHVGLLITGLTALFIVRAVPYVVALFCH